MLDVYTENGWLPVTKRKNYSITTSYNGLEVLEFDLSTMDELYPLIKNETIVRTEKNQYIVKTINSRKTMCSYTCMLDLDEWKTKAYINTNYVQGLQSIRLSNILEFIKPDGWTIQNAFIKSEMKSIDLKCVTTYDVLMHCQELFQVSYRFDTIEKSIYVIDPFKNGKTDNNIYITPQLNLKQTTQLGESSNLITCLIPLGCELENGKNLDIKAVNGNKDYIENHTYNDRNVFAVWKNEDIKDANTLKETANEVLKELCKPIISFEVTIDDLAQYDDRYKFLNIQMHDIVHVLLNEKSEIIENVMEIKRFPDRPNKNIITLSSKPQTIQNKLDKVTTVIGDKGDAIKDNILTQAKSDATKLLNSWAEKGHVYLTENEIYIMDASDKNVAKNIIRINQGGIGFTRNGINSNFDTAWTITGAFTADYITAGILRGIEISNGNGFHVDNEGNLNAKNATINGTIDSSVIIGSSIQGATITGSDLISENKANGSKTKINSGTSLYIRNDKDIGYIGTSQYANDHNIIGLSFNIEPNGNYMSFASKDNESQDTFFWKLIYARTAFANYKKDTLNLGCTLDTHGNHIQIGGNKNVEIVPYTNGAGIYLDKNSYFSFTKYNENDPESHYTIFSINNSEMYCGLNINLNGNSILNQSDERLKTNICDSKKECLGTINSINLSEFDWIDNDEHVPIGAIAQQVQSIDPDLVNEDKDGILSIKTSDLIWYLVGAVQELNNEIVKLGGAKPRKEIKYKNKQKDFRNTLDIKEISKNRRYVKPDKPNKAGSHERRK